MRFRRFLGCLLAVAGLVGCAVHTDDGSVVSAGTVVGSPVAHVGEDIVAENELARLDELTLFDVGELIVGLPAMATNCYGACPEWTAMSEEEQQAEIDAIRDAQEVRLAALVSLAEEVQTEEVYRIDPATVDEHLGALRNLGILEVGDMVVTEPDNDPACYNLPCADDIARADEENSLRAGRIAALALRAGEEGI